MGERMDSAIDAAWPVVRRAISIEACVGGLRDEILDRAQTPDVLAQIAGAAAKYGVSEGALTAALLEGGTEMDAALNAPADTDDRISALEVAAGEAGDLEQASLCRAALAGDAAAYRTCVRVLLAADADNAKDAADDEAAS